MKTRAPASMQTEGVGAEPVLEILKTRALARAKRVGAGKQR